MTSRPPEPSPRELEREAQRLERTRRLRHAELHLVELQPPRDDLPPPWTPDPDPKEAA